MRILLINPNRYVSPPVPPIGLEHVAGTLDRIGHEVALLDLCFSTMPEQDVRTAISSFRPYIAGITVRNIDTVLYQANEFFLDDIRGMIRVIKDHAGLKVIIGGVGVSTNPAGVLEYLGADYAVEGPSEDALPEILCAAAGGRTDKRLFRGRYRYDITCRRNRGGVDYGAYIEKGGIAGFATHTGCTSSCVYCIEASTPVSFRPASEVVEELRGFVDEGISRFHLCDPEFNEDSDYCISFCECLKKSGMNIDWAVYMKPANFSRKLIKLMRETGVSLITLSVDSWKKCPLYWDDIQKFIFSARSAGIRIVVDFLTGFPLEDEDILPFYLDLFRRSRPDSVGINTYIRLYKRMRITEIIMQDNKLRQSLAGCRDDASLVKPVFFNRIREEALQEAIGGDSLFRIEGLDRGVNYIRQSDGQSVR